MHCINAEILKCAGDRTIHHLHKLLCEVWVSEDVPTDWRDALMAVVYKGKGCLDKCGNFRGISLLSAIGKVLCRILLDRLVGHEIDGVLPELQSGFRLARGTVDRMFSAHLLQGNVSTRTCFLSRCCRSNQGI